MRSCLASLKIVEADESTSPIAPDFTLKRLDGEMVKLPDLRNRVVVLEFGSYTSPSFRQRAKGMESLRKSHGRKATFLIIYTREAHPAGEWDVPRNTQENISVEQHLDEEGRKKAARAARDALDIDIPIACDTMDDATARAYDGFPNGAFVIARDGTIAARQKWCDPEALKRHIDAAFG